MKSFLVRCLALAALLGLAACDEDPTVVPDTTIVRVKGGVTEFARIPTGDPAPVAGAWVVSNLMTAEGGGFWATDSTDAVGQYALDLEAPTVCEEGDSLLFGAAGQPGGRLAWQPSGRSP